MLKKTYFLYSIIFFTTITTPAKPNNTPLFAAQMTTAALIAPTTFISGYLQAHKASTKKIYTAKIIEDIVRLSNEIFFCINAEKYNGQLDYNDVRPLINSPWQMVIIAALLYTLYNDCDAFINNKTIDSPLFDATTKNTATKQNASAAVLGYTALPLCESIANIMLGLILETEKVGRVTPSVIEYPFIESFIFLKNSSLHAGEITRNNKHKTLNITLAGLDTAQFIHNLYLFFCWRDAKIKEYTDFIRSKDTPSKPYRQQLQPVAPPQEIKTPAPEKIYTQQELDAISAEVEAFLQSLITEEDLNK